MQTTLDLDQKDIRTAEHFGWLIEAKLFPRTVTEGGESGGIDRRNGQAYWRYTGQCDVWETWITKVDRVIHVQGAANLIKDPETAIALTKDYIETFFTVIYCGERIASVDELSLTPGGAELEPVCTIHHGYRGPTITRWYVALVKDGEAMLVNERSPFRTEDLALAEIQQMQADGWVY